jgi:hypothetical protein
MSLQAGGWLYDNTYNVLQYDESRPNPESRSKSGASHGLRQMFVSLFLQLADNGTTLFSNDHTIQYDHWVINDMVFDFLIHLW